MARILVKVRAGGQYEYHDTVEQAYAATRFYGTQACKIVSVSDEDYYVPDVVIKAICFADYLHNGSFVSLNQGSK